MVLAFPTAKGAGAYSTGGRGGQIIHVTTLDWDAAGGLKEALQTTGARTIVFDVSGEIDATQETRWSTILNGSQYSDLTIAGQTAPEGGITILTSEFQFENVSNMIVRYVRFRKGLAFPTGGGSFPDRDTSIFRLGGDIIFDHCTFSHGNDECLDLSDTLGNVTVQNCFFQDSKTGLIMGMDSGSGDFTFVNNAVSNISHRFPNTRDNGNYDIINNVVYNWKDRLVRVTGNNPHLNVINNYYKPATNGLLNPSFYNGGPIPISNLQKVQTQAGQTTQIYTSGNIITGQRETPQSDDSDMWAVFAGSHLTENGPLPLSYFTSTQHTLLGETFTIKTANEAYTDLIINGNVGAYKYLNADGSVSVYRDTRDTTLLAEAQNDTYNEAFYADRFPVTHPTISTNTRPVGYYNTNAHIPEVWGQANIPGFSATSHNELAPSGYTWVEEFYNQVDVESTVNIPVITRTDSNPTSIEQGGVYTPPTGTWTDVEDGSGIATVGGDTVDVNTPGVYNVTLEHTDTDGNRGFLTIAITITETQQEGLTPGQIAIGKYTILRLIKKGSI